MTCEEIRDQLVETARGRELSSDLRKIVFAHTSECAACAMRLAREQRLTVALSDLSLADNGAPARLENLIRQQLPVVSMRRANPKRWVLASAMAAAALIVGALLLQTTSAHPASQVPVAQIEPADTDGFVPLPYAPELAPDEQAEMVRVEMPRESLWALGLPVSHEFSDDQVQADVLLGMDGTARAIRIAN